MTRGAPVGTVEPGECRRTRRWTWLLAAVAALLAACSGSGSAGGGQIDPRFFAFLMPTSPADQQVVFDTLWAAERQRAQTITACMREHGHPAFEVRGDPQNAKPLTNIPALSVIAEHGWFNAEVMETYAAGVVTTLWAPDPRGPVPPEAEDFQECLAESEEPSIIRVVRQNEDAEAIELEYFDRERALWADDPASSEAGFTECAGEHGVDLSTVESDLPDAEEVRRRPSEKFLTFVGGTMGPLMSSGDVEAARAEEMRLANIFVTCLEPIEEARAVRRADVREELVERHRDTLVELSAAFEEALAELE